MLSRTKVAVASVVLAPVLANVVAAVHVLKVRARVVSLLSAVKVVVKADAASTAKAVVVHVVKTVRLHHVVVTRKRAKSS